MASAEQREQEDRALLAEIDVLPAAQQQHLRSLVHVVAASSRAKRKNVPVISAAGHGVLSELYGAARPCDISAHPLVPTNECVHIFWLL